MAGVDPVGQTTDRTKLLAELVKLEERLDQQERAHPRPAVTNAAPTGAARDGTIVLVDTGASRLIYARINGVWRSTTLS